MSLDVHPVPSALDGIPLVPADRTLGKKDFTSDQEIRWCPGCGDYAVLAAFQTFLPELGVAPENTVVISGIGCSSRFPYYVDSYGMHSIHGRAPTIATGLAASRPDLSVWIATGDGDALSIGGNHLIHTLRRNVNVKILLFNNRIYGLTKGQYSPTSPEGLVTKSSPAGALDHPFSPIRVALGADATFVARTAASDRAHLTEVLRVAARHRGSAFIEIYQNCPIFNDGAYDVLRDGDGGAARVLRLADGEPMRFGDRVLVRDPAGGLRPVAAESVPESDVVVHDSTAADATGAFALACLDGPEMDCVPMGIFRRVQRATYDDKVRDQVALAMGARGGAVSDDDLAALVAGKDTWSIS